MKRCLALLIAGLLLALGGCVSKYAKPYSAKKAVAMLGPFYGVEIEPVSKRIGNRAPYASYYYTMRDKTNGFTFTVASRVRMDRHIPIVQREISDNYPLCCMIHRRAEAQKIAQGYGMRLIPADSAEGASSHDRVYISAHDQIEQTVKLFFDLKRCYGFHFGELPAGANYFDPPTYRVSYLADQESDPEQAVSLYDFHYAHYTVFGGKPDDEETESGMRSTLDWRWDERVAQETR